MNESRQQLYLNLINNLLTCEEGEEAEILRANADLIDAELVAMMERVVSVLEERDAKQQAEWLQELANGVAGSLGMPLVSQREERDVYEQVRSLERRFGKGHLYFAYHAAFPLALTPDLCYQIWANFQRDVGGNLLNIPWIAVADLLLSGLCRLVGHELYEMDLAVRNLLLKELRNHLNFREGRIEELSRFMLEYVREQINSEDEDIRDFATVQKWTALAYVKPDAAAQELALTLREKVREGNKAELVRLSSVLESLAEPLRGEYEPLLVYGRGMGRLARGDSEGAKGEFQGLGEVGNWLSVSRVGLPIPGEVGDGDVFGDLALRFEWRQDNLDLIQLLLNCSAGEEGEILRRHPHLVDSVLVEMMRQVAATLREVGEGNVAEFLVAVADTLAEAFDSGISDDAIAPLRMNFSKAVRSLGKIDQGNNTAIAAKEIFQKPLRGIVDEEIGVTPGRLRFKGTYWPAMLDENFRDRATLKPGDQVEVIGRTGITLLVRPLDKEIFQKPLRGVVEEEIGVTPGRLRFKGSYWPAMLDEDFRDRVILKPGEPVKVIGCTDITLLVQPLDDDRS